MVYEHVVLPEFILDGFSGRALLTRDSTGNCMLRKLTFLSG